MGDWNSELYMKFESERTRAARDLLAQVSDIKPKTVFDLGSGPGNSTQLLVEAFPDAEVVGIDDSPNMLEVARARVSGARFLKEDIERWRPSEAADGPWSDRLVPIAKTRAVIGPLDEYYRLLRPLCSRLDIWQTTYIHTIDGVDRIVEWFEGSELRPFLKPLSEQEREAFLARYREGLTQSYAPQSDGTVLLPYPRLFLVAQK